MNSSIITLHDMGFNNLRKKVLEKYTFSRINYPKVEFLKNVTHFELLKKFELVNFHEIIHDYSTHHTDR